MGKKEVDFQKECNMVMFDWIEVREKIGFHGRLALHIIQ